MSRSPRPSLTAPYNPCTLQVLASYGHVRELAAKVGSVLPDEQFAMRWQLTRQGSERMRDIEVAARDCSRLVLATDPDREGEAISWHITEELKVSMLFKTAPSGSANP